ncbi:DUF6638 family protein [Halocynthiibacter namhaensis]|uniref:DUF6638 family protein n=1 Tax=Halocynthiibacter namhaensis TaxID=1290553 RepID=UPI00057951E1|nr:DUF6638 family protein [Halocynthiibacter namhaensis]
MKRLIQHGLMFGNLIEVSSPALVARYNRALDSLTGKTTDLTDFHIDISGYSPEIGDELGDHLYLNHGGCNRQFILLTTDQKTAPLLNAKFSTSRGILRQFIERNESQLFALTTRDAVAGELLNSVYAVDGAQALFDIRQITIEADTTEAHVSDARRLEGMITRFRHEDDGWLDDVLIADMITLAKKTGDVTRQPINLKTPSFSQENFWTAHFGGIYLFQNMDHPALISREDKVALGNRLPIKHVFDFDNRNQIAKFLEYNDLVEPIVKARGVDAAAILQQKMDFIVMDVAADAGEDLTGATRRDLRAMARRYGADLPKEFHGLADLLRWANGAGKWPKITSEHPAYFYTLRARNHADRDLVNMLLAELTPKDIRQLFICHKERFYQDYASWPDAKKGFVAEFLARDYMVDKAGARAALFGGEDTMDESSQPSRAGASRQKFSGPWGSAV